MQYDSLIKAIRCFYINFISCVCLRVCVCVWGCGAVGCGEMWIDGLTDRDQGHESLK